METHFHQQLDALRLKVLEMAAYADKAVDNAITALLERDTDLAQYVIDRDETVNQLECEIDEMSLRLLALDHPMAGDLRFIVGCMRAIVNFERIGDEAVNIAERSLVLANRPPLQFNAALENLAEESMDMLRTAIKSFKDEDPELARVVCEQDNKVNEKDLIVVKKLIDNMITDTPAIERSVHTLLVSRSLERIGDLSTNIAEATIFIVQGVNIKHRCSRV